MAFMSRATAVYLVLPLYHATKAQNAPLGSDIARMNGEEAGLCRVTRRGKLHGWSFLPLSSPRGGAWPEEMEHGEVDDMEMTGTLRWPATHRFPEFEAKRLNDTALRGWRAFLDAHGMEGRVPSLDGGPEGVHPSLVDGLSFPLSIVWATRRFGWVPSGHTVLLLCVGASRKTEERLLRQTRYFDLLGHAWDSVRMVRLLLIGEEISRDGGTAVLAPKRGKGKKKRRRKKEELLWTSLSDSRDCNVEYCCVRGSVEEILRDHVKFLSAHRGSRLAVGFNTGMGNTNATLRASWAPSIVQLLDSGMPCLFTCANDHTDVQGELTLMRSVFGAQFVVPPLTNPFHGCTTFVPEDGPTSSWASANSHLYAVQGYEAASAEEEQEDGLWERGLAATESAWVFSRRQLEEAGIRLMPWRDERRVQGRGTGPKVRAQSIANVVEKLQLHR